MGVSYFAAPESYSHEERVAWMEWQGDEEYEQIEEATPTLDALGGKGKGKGKGKDGKGFGKGRGKGQGLRQGLW